MTTNQHGQSEIEIISDLIRINYARAECFEQSIRRNETLDMESAALLIQLFKRCKLNVAELIRLTVLPEHFFPKFLLSPGFIFDVWLEKKENRAKEDRHSLLRDCECREDAALEAYKAALISDLVHDNTVRQLILDHKHALQVTQDKLRKQADTRLLLSGETGEKPFIKIDSTFINTKAG